MSCDGSSIPTLGVVPRWASRLPGDDRLGEIRDFVQRQFQPRGTILGVAGRVDWGPLQDFVGRLFADWRPTTARP